jgi:low affinity Fe/Cu permease
MGRHGKAQAAIAKEGHGTRLKARALVSNIRPPQLDMASSTAKSAKLTAIQKVRGKFSEFALIVSRASGHPLAFLLALLVVIVWGATGPIFGYSDTWQLVINTGTTIVTFLMVFLIQNTQNRDTLALQLKLDELVLAQKGAHNSFVDLENLSDAELERVHKDLCKRADHTFSTLEGRRRTAKPHTAKKRRAKQSAK